MSSNSLRENWTQDAAGQFVDWTKPPHRHPNSGILVLLLEGEIAHKLSAEDRVKRIQEYYALVRREMAKR